MTFAVVVVFAVVGLILLAGPGAQMVGGQLGLFFGTASGALGLALVVRALAKHQTNALLAAIGLSFLARAILVSLGLVAAIKQQASTVAYIAAFFTLFVASAALEGLVATGAARPRVP